MSATFGQVHKTTSSTRPLWIAVGALGAAVLAMAATLVYLQARPAESRMAPMPAMASVPSEAAPAPLAAPTTALTTSPSPQAAMRQDESEKPVAAAVKKSPVAAKSAVTKSDRATASTASANASSQGAGSNPAAVSSGSPAVASGNPVVEAQPAPAPTPQAARSVCGNCGTVESATPIQREGAGTGLGAVAGGVLGAVVGNQVGAGNGRTAAMVLGALGGGWAGNSVEKKMRKETLYQVRVRMEDGGSRTFEAATPVSAVPCRKRRRVRSAVESGSCSIMVLLSSPRSGAHADATGWIRPGAGSAPPGSLTTKLWSGDQVSRTASPGAHNSARVARSTFCS